MKRPRTRKLIVMVLLLLTSGAIVNVAVAWGFALWTTSIQNSLSPDTRLSNKDSSEFMKNHLVDLTLIDESDISGLRNRAIGRTFSECIVKASPDKYLEVCEFGCPLRSLSYEFGNSLSDGSWRNAVTPPGWVPVAAGYRYPRVPTGVLWPGFAINTMFYAAVLWVLFAGPFALRRIIRARRGLCPACAYPVGSNDVCTECGTPVRRRCP